MARKTTEVIDNRAASATARKNDNEAMKRKIIKVSKARAIELAMNLNGVSRELAEKYTDSELREVLRLLKLKANF